MNMAAHWAHQHLGLGKARLEVVEVEGGVKGEEADLGALIAGQRLQAVLDGRADDGQRARLHRRVRHVDRKEVPGRHRRPDLATAAAQDLITTQSA